MKQLHPMKRTITLIFAIAASIGTFAATVSFEGAGKKILSVAPDKQSGLDALFVSPSASGVTLVYKPDQASATATLSRYSSLGGGYAESVAWSRSGDGTYRLADVKGDLGYVIEEGGKRTYIWLVNYSAHPLSLSSIGFSAEQDCSTANLAVKGTGEEIAYFGINGRRFVLDRDITLEYSTLTWNAEAARYESKTAVEKYPSLKSELHVSAPLCATDFTLSGDRFLREWGETVSVTSPEYAPKAVEAQTHANQTQRDVDNEVPANTQGTFGGSAPCEIEFSASVTDAAIFTEWQFSRTETFDDINLRVSDPVFKYTFTEEGITYVRFYCANADASCDYTSPVFDIAIGTSMLKCPNAFSPHNQDGVNDEWRVAYSSIISFECHIFNRSGQEITSFNDPAKGWDGKYKGKFVPAGVYYYVIKAKGADGRKYNLSGDINIVNYK